MSEICEDIRLSQIDKYGVFVRQYDHFGCSIFIIFRQIVRIYRHTTAGASPGFGRWGSQEFFFSDLKSCMSRSQGGSGACPPPEKFFSNGAIWCVLVYILIRFCL